MSNLLHGSLQDTDYVEIDSKAGHRYGVWVTTPPGYADATDPLPLIYVVDGNWSVGITAPLIVAQADPFLTVAPYIQVTIGYAGPEAASWAQLRNRDLVPPGEPISDEMVETVQSAAEAGAMTQAEADAYLEHLADTRADVFLEFLTTEVHPYLQDHYRVSESGHGLFGYSYGGLFALYAWLRAAGPFATFGAGTPGIESAKSQTFELARQLPQSDSASSRLLHITLNEVELLGDMPVYRRIARNVLTLVDELRTAGHAEISSALLRETHVTGLQASFLSYLKTCHSRALQDEHV